MKNLKIGIAFKFLISLGAVFLLVQAAVSTLSMITARDIAHGLVAASASEGGTKQTEGIKQITSAVTDIERATHDNASGADRDAGPTTASLPVMARPGTADAE